MPKSPSHLRNFWKSGEQRAKESRMLLVSWIFTTVEAVSDDLSEPSEELAIQGEALREDNRKLRRDAEKNESRIRELETEVFNLRHNAILSRSSRDAPYSTTLVKLRRRTLPQSWRGIRLKIKCRPMNVSLAIISQSVGFCVSFFSFTIATKQPKNIAFG